MIHNSYLTYKIFRVVSIAHCRCLMVGRCVSHPFLHHSYCQCSLVCKGAPRNKISVLSIFSVTKFDVTKVPTVVGPSDPSAAAIVRIIYSYSYIRVRVV